MRESPKRTIVGRALEVELVVSAIFSRIRICYYQNLISELLVVGKFIFNYGFKSQPDQVSLIALGVQAHQRPPHSLQYATSELYNFV